jgi:hypothetical protein
LENTSKKLNPPFSISPFLLILGGLKGDLHVKAIINFSRWHEDPWILDYEFWVLGLLAKPDFVEALTGYAAAQMGV